MGIYYSFKQLKITLGGPVGNTLQHVVSHSRIVLNHSTSRYNYLLTIPQFSKVYKTFKLEYVTIHRTLVYHLETNHWSLVHEMF